MTTWVVVLAVGAGSFALRLVPLLVLERRQLSGAGERLVGHAGTAAVAALVAGSARHSATGAAIVPTIVAVALAGVLAARGASLARLLACGGAVYAVLLLGARLAGVG